MNEMRPIISSNQPPDARDTIEQFLSAIADAIADRLEHRQQTRRRLLTLEEAADYLAMSENQVLNLIAEGKLKRSNLDRRVRVDIRELDRLIEETKGHSS